MDWPCSTLVLPHPHWRNTGLSLSCCAPARPTPTPDPPSYTSEVASATVFHNSKLVQGAEESLLETEQKLQDALTQLQATRKENDHLRLHGNEGESFSRFLELFDWAFGWKKCH